MLRVWGKSAKSEDRYLCHKFNVAGNKQQRNFIHCFNAKQLAVKDCSPVLAMANLTHRIVNKDLMRIIYKSSPSMFNKLMDRAKVHMDTQNHIAVRKRQRKRESAWKEQQPWEDDQKRKDR